MNNENTEFLALAAIRVAAQKRLSIIMALKDAFLVANPNEFTGTFMEGVMDTPYDDEISVLALINNYANDAINQADYIC